MEPGVRAKILITDGDIKQKKLAEHIGISEAKLSHYLTGRYEMPTHVVAAIAQYFHVSTDYLLGLTDDPQPPFPVSRHERALLADLRALSPDQRELAEKTVALMREQNGR